MTSDTPVRHPSPAGRPAPAGAADGGRDPLSPPSTDWLRHDLVVSGPAADVATLRDAAAGAGAIPWTCSDDDLEEEDRVHALLHPPDGSPGLSLADARALARALRAAAEAHHQRVLAAAGRSRACPFDLHALLPAPDRILRLGPDHPASIAWLRRHWGTLQPLRHVRLLEDTPDRRLRRSARLRCEFWSADWTPWPALLALRARWPDVAFDLRPDYGRG